MRDPLRSAPGHGLIILLRASADFGWTTTQSFSPNLFGKSLKWCPSVVGGIDNTVRARVEDYRERINIVVDPSRIAVASNTLPRRAFYSKLNYFFFLRVTFFRGALDCVSSKTSSVNSRMGTRCSSSSRRTRIVVLS